MSSSSPSNTSNDYKPTSYQSLVEDYYEQKHPRDVAQNQFDSNMPVITQADDKGSKLPLSRRASFYAVCSCMLRLTTLLSRPASCQLEEGG
jgi:hypothetical protein